MAGMNNLRCQLRRCGRMVSLRAIGHVACVYGGGGVVQ
jgi:hypothetical protein